MDDTFYKKYYIFSEKQLKNMKGSSADSGAGGEEQAGGYVDIEGEGRRSQLIKAEKEISNLLNSKKRKNTKVIKKRAKSQKKSKKKSTNIETQPLDLHYQKLKHLNEKVQRILDWFRNRESGPNTPPVKPVVSMLTASQPQPRDEKNLAQRKKRSRSPTLQPDKLEQVRRKRRKSYSTVIAQGASRSTRSKTKGTLPVNWITLDSMSARFSRKRKGSPVKSASPKRTAA